MVSTRQFGAGDWAVRDPETAQTHLMDYAENAIYGVELAWPEVASAAYRVELVKTLRQAQGVEAEQRLTLAQYPSQMGAEESQTEWETQLYEGGKAAIAPQLTSLNEQPVTYPPDDPTSVVLLAVDEAGVQQGMVGRDLHSHDASRLVLDLEQAHIEGGLPLLLEQAAQVPAGYRAF